MKARWQMGYVHRRRFERGAILEHPPQMWTVTVTLRKGWIEGRWMHQISVSGSHLTPLPLRPVTAQKRKLPIAKCRPSLRQVRIRNRYSHAAPLPSSPSQTQSTKYFLEARKKNTSLLVFYHVLCRPSPVGYSIYSFIDHRTWQDRLTAFR
jgi:hypothetical protein